VVESVFSEWGRYAVWEHELTELALWDVDTRRFSRFYEILRSGENYYFRSIAGLTRPVLTHGVEVNAPLLFTEPEARRQAWLRQKDEQTWRGITDSIKQQTAPTPRTTSDIGK